ncbi:putative membrane protein [Enterovirga rhinocerotis]|uniref:Putative membrane protein n=2 Tax=Enterovirga rhinocerotis TaxID=1339210 RepID=A0A4R7C785_9HYPH|nr:putative membrane protein [Enterovirga rhinocerotis]
MKGFVVFAAIAGIALFGGLVAYSGLGDVGSAVAAAGWATLFVVLIRAVVISGCGLSWHLLFPPEHRLPVWVAIGLRFVREGVNTLLPVAMVGGDVVGARLATFWRVNLSVAGATTIADVAIQAATSAAFAILGIGVLMWLHGDGPLVRYAAMGAAVAVLLIAAFFVAQARIGSRLLNALLARLGVKGTATELVERLWSSLAAIYAAPGRVARSTLVHMLVWIAGTFEVQVALHFMGYPVSFAEALVIESLGQAVRGAAFAVPGGLGVQEGGLVALCALFGIPPGPALALSILKRVAELALGLPALIAWQLLEGRRVFRRSEPDDAVTEPRQ